MRSSFFGLMLALACSAAWAQNKQTGGQGTQPGGAGQKQGEPAGQGDTVRGQAPASQAGINQGQPGTQQGQLRQGQQNPPGQQFQQTQPGQQFSQGQARQQGQQRQGQHSRSDQEIAACVYGEASNEIEIAKLAEQKAQSDEVRKFAQQMIREHSPGAQEMQQLAGNLASGSARGGERGGEGGLDWVSVKKEIGQQCLASVKQELSQKSSAEFDHCFMGQQIAAHMKVVDELRVLRNHASQDLQQKLDKELQMAQHHLEHAKQIEQKLDRPERVARKPE